MYTQCPYCQTLFRISTEQLNAAAGKAHCCRCDQVFSALDQLREPQPDESWPESRFIDNFPEHPNLELPFDSSPPEEHPPEMQSSLTELLQALQITPENETAEPDAEEADEHPASHDERDPFEPLYIFNDPEMDSVQIGLDSQLYSTLEPTADSGQNPAILQPAENEPVDSDTEPQRPAAAPGSGAPAPFDIPDDLPEIQPAETAPLTLEEALEQDRDGKRGTLGWSLAILILLLVALGQLAWFGRDHLLQYPAGRQALEVACHLLPCQLPPRRAPDQLHVVSRAITSHPDRENALLVMLTLRNDAPFIQPWPQVELSLLDSAGGLIARRGFHPDEYRSSATGELQPGIPETLRLELEDPGDQVVGFQFDFH